MDPEQVRAIAQVVLFKPYYEERRLHKWSTRTLPEIAVHVSSIGPEKLSRDRKDFYQCFVHFKPEVAPSKDTDFRLALGNKLMDKLSSWNVMHPNKPKMDVTLTKVEGHVIYEVVNLALGPQPPAVWRYSVNQAIMDMIAEKLILAWSPYSTTFVLHITLQD